MARLHTVENFVSTAYTAPAGNTVQGATVKVTLAQEFTANDDAVTVVFVTDEQFQENAVLAAGITLDAATKALCKAQNFSAKPSSVVALANAAGNIVLVAGLGKKVEGGVTAATLRSAVAAATAQARRMKLPQLQIAAPIDLQVLKYDQVATGFGFGVKGTTIGHNAVEFLTADEVVALTLRTVVTKNYFFDKYLKQATVDAKHYYFAEVVVVANNTNIANVHTVVHEAESENFAKELGSLRLDVASSVYIKDQCEAFAKVHSDIFTIKVYGKEEMIKAGLNLMLAVNQGSHYPPFIVAFEYTPPNNAEAQTQRPYAFVGKTLTFDTGGYDLKPPSGMLDMALDKLGGCNTFALMRTLALTRPTTTRKVVGVMAITDNMVSATAITPKSIIETPKGSVSIDNTDAEGRLILASALEFVQNEYNPARITTMATLTGAILIALGHNTGVFTNNKAIADELYVVGDKNGDLFWNMPITKQNHAQIEGVEADITNISKTRWGGSSTAAAFLEKFINDDVEFCHLDIAGSASTDAGEVTGATISTLQELMAKY